MTKKSKTQQVTSILDNMVEGKISKTEETEKEAVPEPTLVEVPPSTDVDTTNEDGEIVDDVEPVESAEGTKPGALASWVNAGAAGLKVAAGVGANLATATAEMTRTSIQKVTDVTKNISFASADSIRYTKLYDSFNKEEKTIEITVNAGTFAQIPFFVPKGRAIVWKILVKTLDIGLSFKLRVQELGGAIEHDLEYERKVMAGEYCVGDRKETTEDRHIVMILNNKLSKLRNKTLVYKVTIAQPEVIAEVKEQYAKEAEEFAAQAVAAKAEAPAETKTEGGDSDEQGDDSTAPAKATSTGLVGNLLSLSSTYISTAQANAGILVQRAQENPRVNGALSFIQTSSTGVLGRFGWGGNTKKETDKEPENEVGTEEGEAVGSSAVGAVVAGGAESSSGPGPLPTPPVFPPPGSATTTTTTTTTTNTALPSINTDISSSTSTIVPPPVSPGSPSHIDDATAKFVSVSLQDATSTSPLKKV